MSKNDRNAGPIRIGRIMDDVLSACGLDQRIAERALLAAWPQIAGERIAAHVRAVDLRDGVLFLSAEHGAWRQEVSLLLPRLRGECNRRFGPTAVHDIRWIHGWTDTQPADNGR